MRGVAQDHAGPRPWQGQCGDERSGGSSVEGNSEYAGGVEVVLFVDTKRGQGQGQSTLTRAVYKAGWLVNEQRITRGLNDWLLMVGIIVFPNVGKSALINRLLGHKREKTANMPGMTRPMQWIRVATNKTTMAMGALGWSAPDVELVILLLLRAVTIMVYGSRDLNFLIVQELFRWTCLIRMECCCLPHVTASEWVRLTIRP